METQLDVFSSLPVRAPRLSLTRPILLYGESYHHPNIYYRTGFLAPDPVVLIDEGGKKTTLWVSGLEYGRACKDATVGSVRCFSELNLAPYRHKATSNSLRQSILLAAICDAHGINDFDVEMDFPALHYRNLLHFGITTTPTLSLYERRRRVKTQEEAMALANTQRAGMNAVEAAISLIKAATIQDGILHHNGSPLTSAHLIHAVESRLLELGCSTIDSICCGGPESSDPHKTASSVLRAGLPIVLDIYPMDKKSRYWGDMTRTVVRGTPPPEVMKMWDAVFEAQQAGLNAVKPGANGRDIHQAVCEVLKKHGYGSSTPPYDAIASSARFIHGTGHGVGLELHESPHIGGVDVTLKVGDAITVEPGLYDPQFGGIRIEDLVIVTSAGYHNLTPLPKIFRLDKE